MSIESEQNGKPVWALALHGGASTGPSKHDEETEAFMAQLLKSGGEMLQQGASSIETVKEMVRGLESSGLYLAGKGAAPNKNGEFELDAAIMDGETRLAGSVAGLKGFEHPVDVAELVMLKTPHIMLVGQGAAQFAGEQKCARIENPDQYYTPVKYDLFDQDERKMTGTVGAVALDIEGALAAATSTGGAPDKVPGRVGDCPIIGSGTWADERVAVSCTGMGEYFMRANAAADVSARICYARTSLDVATRAVLENVLFLGGKGGLISIDRLGRIAMPFISGSMARGSIHSNGEMVVATL